MARLVTKWVAEDGQEFATEEAADHYEGKRKILNDITKTMTRDFMETWIGGNVRSCQWDWSQLLRLMQDDLEGHARMLCRLNADQRQRFFDLQKHMGKG